MRIGGAGNWPGFGAKTPVERCRSLDTGRWVRARVIAPVTTTFGTWTWRDRFTGETRSSLEYEAHATADGSGWVRLTYRVGTEGPAHNYRVGLLTTRPHFGGLRWWFRCPLIVNGQPCGRRVKMLYLARGLFGCRECHDLTYLSCQGPSRPRLRGA